MKKKKLLSIIFSCALILVSSGCANNLLNNNQSINKEDYNTFDGYIVEGTTNETTTKETTVPFHDEDKYMYATENLNLRSDYNTNSDILDEIDKFEKVKLIKTNNTWSYVSYNNNENGYVSNDYLGELGNTFVEVDISDQKLYLYVDNNLDYTADVVTGKKGVYDTRLGCNPIYEMDNTGRLLKGPGYEDGVYVKRWMPFDGGIGLHDASWRTNFGSDAYINGSHGCVNMKFEDVDYVYDNVKVGTKVLVHN